LLRRREFDRLVLLGPEEATSELRGLLPHALERRLAAVIPCETAATDAEILERTRELEHDFERAAEQRLVQELLETAGAGGRATVGVEPTLDALWLGEVQTLVVAGGLHVPGSECSNCGRLSAGTIASCPVCGSAVSAVHDLAHRAMGRVLEEAGRVEVVHEQVAEWLQRVGGLGAMLRFKSSATMASIASEHVHGHRVV
jgi:peptide chain release factor subunit 1